jgi:hypothetical protein
MPPYYYDDDVGIQELQHDWRLSHEQINTVVAWVDQGSPLGDPADRCRRPRTSRATPRAGRASRSGRPTSSSARRRSTCRPTASTCGTVRSCPRGRHEDRCIKAIQVKPARRREGRGAPRELDVPAHASRRLDPDGDRASEYAMGKLGEIIPDGVCRIAAGRLVRRVGTSTSSPVASAPTRPARDRGQRGRARPLAAPRGLRVRVQAGPRLYGFAKADRDRHRAARDGHDAGLPRSTTRCGSTASSRTGTCACARPRSRSCIPRRVASRS